MMLIVGISVQYTFSHNIIKNRVCQVKSIIACKINPITIELPMRTWRHFSNTPTLLFISVWSFDIASECSLCCCVAILIISFVFVVILEWISCIITLAWRWTVATYRKYLAPCGTWWFCRRSAWSMSCTDNYVITCLMEVLCEGQWRYSSSTCS